MIKVNNPNIVRSRLRIVPAFFLGSLAALLAILAAATVVEKIFGTEIVRQYVYGAWWFAGVWALFGAAGCAYLFGQFLTHPYGGSAGIS